MWGICWYAMPALAESEEHILKKEVYAGNTQIKEVVVPAEITRIEDGAFAGCSALERIVLLAEEPAQLMVGEHLLDGTRARLVVPEGARSVYRSDYRFSRYADRIE